LLGLPSVRITRPIRTRLVTVAVLGLITAALSTVALYRAIAVSTALRLERAHEGVTEELARVVAGGPDDASAPPAIIGMRAGVLAGALAPSTLGARLPPDWVTPLRALADRAREGGAARIETPLGGAVTLVGDARRLGDGRVAWVAAVVRPSPYIQSWRLIVSALTIAALLLVASAGYALVTVKRGAGSLLTSMKELARDLSAPVPRPPVRELADIADGIARLAGHLAEARQIQERLGRDLARQERLVALGRVVAGVAHEVRNPLASIKLRLDLAMSGDASLPPPVAKAIEHASSEITRLDRLVADLLIVSGRALGPRDAVELGDLLTTRAEALAPWAALRGVAIRTAGRGIAGVDADALARAVDNLLRNAVEAAPLGDLVEADVRLVGDQVVIRVRDRGPGVPLPRAGELFEPFFTTKADGTGLGLAICRAIARAHGGDVAYSRDANVTAFELTLPRPAAVPERIA
jgi:signal transduction histidine kinase